VKPGALLRLVQGQDGFPIVDAAMRQLSSDSGCTIAFGRSPRFSVQRLPDRLASRRKLLYETFYGWGLCVQPQRMGTRISIEVDPQLYFRIFTPLRQSGRFDSDLVYSTLDPGVAWYRRCRIHRMWSGALQSGNFA
jgi:hypothetical protein